MNNEGKSYSKATLGLFFFTVIFFGTYDSFHTNLFPLLDIVNGTNFEWFKGFFYFIWDLMGLIFIGGTILGMILSYQKREPRSDIEYVQF